MTWMSRIILSQEIYLEPFVNGQKQRQNGRLDLKNPNKPTGSGQHKWVGKPNQTMTVSCSCQVQSEQTNVPAHRRSARRKNRPRQPGGQLQRSTMSATMMTVSRTVAEAGRNRAGTRHAGDGCDLDWFLAIGGISRPAGGRDRHDGIVESGNCDWPEYGPKSN